MISNELKLNEFVEQIEKGVCSTTADFILALSKMSTSDRMELASLPDYFYRVNLPLDLQKLLSQDKSWYVRLSLAKNKHVFPEVIEGLSKSKSTQILSCVAINPNTPLKVLEELSLNKKLRPDVARNPNISSQLFEEFYKEKDCIYSLIINHNTPQHLLRDIWSKRESFDRWDIQSLFINRNLPYDVFKSMGEYEGLIDKGLLYSNPSCPPDLLSEWSEKAVFAKGLSTLEMISNPNMPEERLYHFYKSSDFCVREAVINNTKCPKDILITLSKDDRPHVSKLAEKALSERTFSEEGNIKKNSLGEYTTKERKLKKKQTIKPNPYIPMTKKKGIRM